LLLLPLELLLLLPLLLPQPPLLLMLLQLKRLKAINATVSFTMGAMYPMAKDYFNIYNKKQLRWVIMVAQRRFLQDEW
jgi:hypothetical protein